jgi:hypothetical protein
MSFIDRPTGMPRSTTQTALSATGFGGVLFALTFLVPVAMAPSHDALRATISALEFTALGFAQAINFLVFGLMLMAFALALLREMGAGRGSDSNLSVTSGRRYGWRCDLHSRAAAYGARFDRIQFRAAGALLVRLTGFGR